MEVPMMVTRARPDLRAASLRPAGRPGSVVVEIRIARRQAAAAHVGTMTRWRRQVRRSSPKSRLLRISPCRHSTTGASAAALAYTRL